MSDFSGSAWADDAFAANYLDKADIYIIERRRLFWYAASLFRHCFGGRTGLRLLDIGCGDGILTEELLKVDGGLTATLIDGNEGMLKRARERLRSFDTVNFLSASFQEILAGGVKLGSYDICTSSMAIHHLDKSEKAALFRTIHAHLNTGGRFVNIDTVLPPTAELEEWYFAIWRDWLGRMMEKHNVTDEVPEDLIRRYKDPASTNQPDTLGDQLRLLADAGFSEVDCYFKNGIFAVFGGRK